MHEIVEIAMGIDHLGAGAQHQVEGVAQNDFRPDALQLLRRHGLDRGVGAHRHKRRRLHRAAGKGQATAAAGAIAGQHLKIHDHNSDSLSAGPATAAASGHNNMASP